MRPSDSNTALADYCKAVLSGRIRDRWIDSQIDRLLPVYRVIKEIRANLFLNWFSLRFPSTPILYIIRHPCAVVLSHLQVSWEVDEDIASFLAQDRLVADFLSDKLELIRAAKTFEEKVAVVWCVTNLVPLSQFQGVQLNVFFYEHLCTQIEEEIPRIFQAIRHVYRPSVFRSAALPSVTSRLFSPIMTGGSKIDGWQKALHAEQIRRVMAIVDAFGLSHYYDETPMPRANAWVTPPVQPSVACNA